MAIDNRRLMFESKTQGSSHSAPERLADRDRRGVSLGLGYDVSIKVVSVLDIGTSGRIGNMRSLQRMSQMEMIDCVKLPGVVQVE